MSPAWWDIIDVGSGQEEGAMSPETPVQVPHHEDALDHLEQEIKELEGVTRWGRPLRIGGLVILLVAIVGGIAWYVTSPPPITSARMSYIPTTGSPIEVDEPKGATLDEAPTRFAWESVSGRLQYIVRVYVKGSNTPILERMMTAPSFELMPDERSRIRPGNTYIWTVVAQGKDGSTLGAGQSTFKVR
jgi:hypothetical protein